MKIAVQLYSLRDAGDLPAQLAMARDSGFEWVESVATHGLEAQAFTQLLAQQGLRMASMHVSLALLESQFAGVVDSCHRTQCPLVVMPWLPMGERAVGGAAWAALGARLARIGDALQREGLRLAYHNHEFEFLAHDGRAALDWIFEAASPEQLAWEADLGWVCRAGADPWHWLERHGGRLVAVHAKDIAAPRSAVDEDGWAPLGQGVVPWDRLLPHLASRVGLVIFEHDRPRDARAVLQASRALLARHLG
jgi:sugar phosphate isomerase/epimerase